MNREEKPRKGGFGDKGGKKTTTKRKGKRKRKRRRVSGGINEEKLFHSFPHHIRYEMMMKCWLGWSESRRRFVGPFGLSVVGTGERQYLKGKDRDGIKIGKMMLKKHKIHLRSGRE